MKISKFTKFGYVSLHSNQAVTCQRSPKLHTNVSNSEMASPKSIQSLYLKLGKVTNFNVTFLVMDPNFCLNENLKTCPPSPFELWNGQLEGSVSVIMI